MHSDPKHIVRCAGERHFTKAVVKENLTYFQALVAAGSRPYHGAVISYAGGQSGLRSPHIFDGDIGEHATAGQDLCEQEIDTRFIDPRMRCYHLDLRQEQVL